ncbi:MAG: hypothetical protein JWO37_108 [Acidimicrobiales bacterium]|nr:hypothetical protein [Acidimicrobiales bacterium]
MLLLGDSILHLAAPTATDQLEAHGVEVHLEARDGTSPVSWPGNVDWTAIARDAAQSFRPDVVLIMFTGNYTRKITPTADPGICAEWGRGTAAMIAAVRPGRATTPRVIVAESVPGYWTLNPDDAFACEIDGTRGIANVTFVDAGGIVGDPRAPRTRIETLPSCDGGPPVALRTADVHVTPAGARRLGTYLASLIDPAVAPPPRDCA